MERKEERDKGTISNINTAKNISFRWCNRNQSFEGGNANWCLSGKVDFGEPRGLGESAGGLH